MAKSNEIRKDVSSIVSMDRVKMMSGKLNQFENCAVRKSKKQNMRSSFRPAPRQEANALSLLGMVQFGCALILLSHL